MKNKQNIRILISDLDGTLLNDQKRVEPRDALAIHRWINSGHRFWVASGRGHDCKQLLNTDDVFPEYIIGSTGSTIHDANDQLIYRYDAPMHCLKGIVDYLTSLKYCGLMLDNVHGPTIDPTLRYGIDTNHLVSDHIHHDLSTMMDARRLDLSDVSVLKIFTVFSSDPLALQARDYLMDHFDVTAYHADTNCLEIVPKGCSKYHALHQLCNMLDIDLSTVAAIGDEENDVMMIDHAGYGYIMASANASVKAHADHIVSNVAQAIEDLLDGQTID